MFGFSFGKVKKNAANKAPNWNSLDNRTKLAVTRKMIKALGGARYKIVTGTDQLQREAGLIERRDEDEILNAYGRGKILDLARNATRNSSTFNGILKQLDLNVVGTSGGKAIFNFDDASEMKSQFARWTRDADFFDGLSFNTVLKLILKTYILGGDMVLLFDDGLIEDSGKIVLYEPDEIGNTTDEAIKQHFGSLARQSLGRVYNGNGRFIGAVVSRSQRGADVFDPTKSYFLRRDPDASMFDSFWMMPRNVFRVAQGRGVTPLSTSLSTILDLEDLCGFELSAAKKNAQTLAQVLQTSSASNEDAAPPSAFDDDADIEGMTDEEVEEAVKQEQETATQTMTLDRITAAGTIYQVMPENYKIEMLKTERPNPNMPNFISWLAGRSAAPFGLSKQFATLQSTGADFRAEQLLTWPAFYEAQKFLEQICDWVVYRWSIWASRKGIVPTPIRQDELSLVDWSWPKMDELDEVANQNAIEKKLRNMTATYQEILGSDWKEKLEQTAYERAWMKEHGIVHPQDLMLSGGQTESSKTSET